eukprot:PhM_4_TR9193/c0_g1_i1/m.16036
MSSQSRSSPGASVVRGTVGGGALSRYTDATPGSPQHPLTPRRNILSDSGASSPVTVARRPPAPAVSSATSSNDRVALEARVAVLQQDLEAKRRTISKLESEAIAHVRVLGEVRSEEDTRRAALLSQHRKELEGERARLRDVEAELGVESNRRRELEARCAGLEGAAKRVPLLEGRVAEFEKQLVCKGAEVAELERRSSEFEKRVLELQTSNAARVLEGKVAGLQALVDERSQELDELRQRATTSERKSEDLKEALARVTQQLDEMESQVGEKTILVADRDKDVARLESKCTSLEMELDAAVTKATEGERSVARAQSEKEDLAMELRSELRARTRQVSQLEMEKEQLENAVQGAETIAEKARAETTRVMKEKDRAQHEVDNLRQQIEVFETSSAKESVVVAGLRSQLERAHSEVAEVRGELDRLRSVQATLDDHVHDLKSQLRMKDAMEQQLAAVQASFDRQEHDMHAEEQRHAETRLRLEQAEDKIAEIHRAHAKVRELEGETQKLQQRIASQESAIEQKDYVSEELRREMDAIAKQKSQLEEDIEEGRATLEAKDLRIHELEVEIQHYHGIEGKLRATETLADERAAEVRQSVAALTETEAELHELRGQLNDLLPLEERLKEATQEKFQMHAALDAAEENAREVSRQHATLEVVLEQKQKELERDRQALAEAEQELVILRRHVAEKPLADNRTAELEVALAKKGDEVARRDQAIEQLEQRSKALDEDLTRERNRVQMLEKQLAAEVEVVEAAQIEAGKAAVTIEQLQKDVANLTQDNEWRQQQTELAQSQTQRLKDELAQRTHQLERLEAREADRMGLMEEQGEQIQRLTSETESAAKELASERLKCHSLTERVLELEANHRKVTTLEGQVRGLETVLSEKEEELMGLESTVQEHRLRIKQMENDVSTTQTLEQRVRDLRSQVTSQMQSIEDFETQISIKDKVITQKDAEVRRERDTVAGLREDLDRERAATQDRESTIENLLSEVKKQTELMGIIKGLEEVIEAKTEEVSAERHAAETLRNTVRDIESQVTLHDRQAIIVRDLEEQLARKDDVIQRLEAEEVRRRHVVDRLQRDVHTMEEGKLAAETELAQLRAELDTSCRNAADKEGKLEQRLHDLEMEHRALSVDANKVQVICQDLNERLAQESAATARAQERLKHTEEVLFQAKQQLAEMEHEAGTRNVGLETLQRALEAERSNVEHLNTMLMAEHRKKASTDADMKSREAHVNYVERRLESELETRETQLQNLRSDVEELKAQLQRRGDLLHTKTEELAGEVSKRAHIEAQLRRQTDEMAVLEDRLGVANNNVTNARRAQQDALNERTSALSASSEMEKKITLASARVSTLERRLKEEETQSMGLRRQLSTGNIEMTALKEELAEARRMLSMETRDHGARLKATQEESERVRAELKRAKDAMIDSARLDAQRVTDYELTVQALAAKCSGADETLLKLKDQTAYLDDLKAENTRLRSELESRTRALEVNKVAIVDLQRQLSLCLSPTTKTKR